MPRHRLAHPSSCCKEQSPGRIRWDQESGLWWRVFSADNWHLAVGHGEVALSGLHVGCYDCFEVGHISAGTATINLFIVVSPSVNVHVEHNVVHGGVQRVRVTLAPTRGCGETLQFEQDGAGICRVQRENR